VVAGDRYLLCSDGLSVPVPAESLAATLGVYAELDDISLQLIELANEAGGPDNIAALVIECTEGPDKDSVPPPGVAFDAPTRPGETRADPELLILGIEELEALDADSASDDLLRALEGLVGRSS
jgi:protein phosphatase